MGHSQLAICCNYKQNCECPTPPAVHNSILMTFEFVSVCKYSRKFFPEIQNSQNSSFSKEILKPISKMKSFTKLFEMLTQNFHEENLAQIQRRALKWNWIFIFRAYWNVRVFIFFHIHKSPRQASALAKQPQCEVHMKYFSSQNSSS